MKKPTEGMSKAQGMAKQAVAKLSGKHGVLNTLAKEHGEVSALMMRIQATRDDGNGVSTRQEVFEKMVVELLSHAHAEEREVYAILERHGTSEDKARHSRTEHQQIERLINELDGIPYSSDQWMTKFSELMNTVQHHVDEEEHELFDLAKQVLSREELEQMDERFLTEKQKERSMLEGRPTMGGGAGEASPPPAAP